MLTPLLLERGEGVLRDSFPCEGFYDITFEGQAEFIELCQFIDGPSFYGAAKIWLSLDEVDLAQAAECFANGNTTDVKLRADFIFLQVVPREILPRQNPLLETFEYKFATTLTLFRIIAHQISLGGVVGFYSDQSVDEANEFVRKVWPLPRRVRLTLLVD